MEIFGKVVVITGGASGIGKALAKRFHMEGAEEIVIADRDSKGASEVAAEVGGRAATCDVADGDQIRALIDDTVSRNGRVDLVVSNAGYVTVGGLEVSDDEVVDMFQVHVMAHLHAARYAIPYMVEQGGGWLLNTASAAGLLTQIGSLAYSVTKHASVALAEWIAITYGDRGIGVSVLCPQAVETNIALNSPTAGYVGGKLSNVAAGDGVLAPEVLATAVVEGLAEERFYILPHPEVASYLQRKGDDVDRWIAGMRRLQARLFQKSSDPADWLIG